MEIVKVDKDDPTNMRVNSQFGTASEYDVCILSFFVKVSDDYISSSWLAETVSSRAGDVSLPEPV